MAKQIVYGDSSRQGILRGINSLANAVKVTLGPRGRNVILDTKFGSPTITKDGVTVAKEIELKDALENMTLAIEMKPIDLRPVPSVEGRPAALPEHEAVIGNAKVIRCIWIKCERCLCFAICNAPALEL